MGVHLQRINRHGRWPDESGLTQQARSLPFSKGGRPSYLRREGHWPAFAREVLLRAQPRPRDGPSAGRWLGPHRLHRDQEPERGPDSRAAA